jgi:integrase
MAAGFTKKRGSTWTAYYYSPGDDRKRTQHSKGGFRTRRDAQSHLTTMLGAIQTGVSVNRRKLTFEDYLRHHWLPLMRSSVRPTTWHTYWWVLERHVVPHVGQIELQQLTAADLDRLYAHLASAGRCDGKPGGLSSISVRHLHKVVHKALHDAERKQLVPRNVADAADPPRDRSGDLPRRTWTASQVRAFVDGMGDHRFGAAFHLAAMTGMRRGEVLGTRWRDIDFDRNRIAVCQTVVSVNHRIMFGTPKTRRSRRSIALDKGTIAVLSTHRTQQAAERALVGDTYRDLDLVFAEPGGRPVHPDHFGRAFRDSIVRLALPKIRLHDLRHTHATLGLAAGVPAKVMSDRLGHSSVAFTLDRYTHSVPGLDADAANRVAELIFTDDVA